MGATRSTEAASATRSARASLARTALGHELGPDALASLTSGNAEEVLEAGEVLFEQGDPAGDAFVVVRGRLDIVISAGGDEHAVASLGPGAMLGEIAMLAGDHRSATARAAVRSAVLRVTPERLRAVFAANPEVAARVSHEAAERLRHSQLIHQLGTVFGSLPADALAAVEGLIEWVSLNSGEQLFAEGEPGDAGYLIVTGRLRVVRGAGTAGEVELAELGRGDMVGEMALLEDLPRNASVFAARDSQLVRFTGDAYNALLSRHPMAGLAIARTVLRRGQSTLQGTARPLSMVVVPAGDARVADELVAGLLEALGPEAREVTSAVVDEELGISGIAHVSDDEPGAIRLAYWLDELQESGGFVIFRPDDGWTPWSLRALRCADLVLVVADAATDPAPGANEATLHRLLTQQRHKRMSLALVHAADVELPSDTRRWIDPRPVSSHHHVRRGDPVTIGRLARLLSGQGTALVLGGGGARGFAHLGVYSVLEDLGASIDMVAGTSIGAVMGSTISIGWSADRARRTAVEAFNDLFDYTLPSVSLLRGERITAKLRSFLGNIDIADLWIPFFCTSTNLTTAGAHFHDRGDLVQALRASIAIPGVLPPVPMDGELLVDGGVLDNVPVAEMRRRNPTGRILAIDVAPVEGPSATQDYGLSVGGLRAWRERRRGQAGPPSVLTTMVRSSLIASVRDRDRVVRDEVADLYLDLTVEGGGMLDFSTAAAIADSGAACARPALEAWFGGRGEALGSYVLASAPPPAPIDAADSGAPRRGRNGGGWPGVLLLTLRDLQRRAVRFAAVIAGTAVVFTLLFLMTGLVEQFHREPRDTVAAFGADGWLLREGSSGAFTSAATMPADTAEEIEGATRASPVVIARHSIDDGSEPVDIVVVGVPEGGIGEPELRRGERASGADELVVDDSADLDIGDETTIGGRDFTVTGLTDRTTMFAGMPLVFVELATAQDLVYRGEPLATTVLIEGAASDVPAGFAVLDPDDIATDGMRPLERSISSVNLIRVLLWFVAAMIIGTMIYLSALERRRDVAVLTAIGASGRQMGASIALQGALTGLTAALVAAVLQRFVVPVFPLEVTVPGSALLQVPVLAVLVSLVAGGIGLRTALRTDPALAFAGPGG